MSKLEAMDKLGPGSQVWLQVREDDYQLGTVVSRKGDAVKVEDCNGKVVSLDLEDGKTEVLRANARVVPDMTGLSYFHLAGILHNLRERSVTDEPYTFLGGSVLVAVNPLKWGPESKLLGSAGAVGSPHPYAIAELAFQQLSFALSRKGEPAENQSIVVGGESGAGKTESSKLVLRHLVARGGGGDARSDLDQRLLDSNPILEAFGNAATKRNSNSSRFGKFMKLHFRRDDKSKALRIYGARVETYLLERSRVTEHSEGERNYNIFYQLVSGAAGKLRTELSLDAAQFAYLRATAAPGDSAADRKRKSKSRLSMKVADMATEDQVKFKTVCAALGTVGMAPEGELSQRELWGVLAGLLHLGNVQFHEKENGSGDEAAVSNGATLATAAALLGLEPARLERLFCERKVKAVGEVISAKRDPDSAKIALDALAKTVYSNAFGWLVARITASLTLHADFDQQPFIGVLDIFGFETFAVNDFEQLMINYTNEALQNTFNEQIFEAEARLYEKEGLLLQAKDRQRPPNNTETMRLLGGVPGDKSQAGLLALIDAETNAPQASDDKLVTSLQRTFGKNKQFPAPHPKDARQCFIVAHYAGDVKYTCGKFIQKNVDKLPAEVSEVLGGSKSKLVLEMFAAELAGGGGKPAGAGAAGKNSNSTGTIAGKFKGQIEALISTLAKTKASFIRCIKPNARMLRAKGSDEWFNNVYVLDQLRKLGIPQTAEVLQGGLPTRLPFDVLSATYQPLLPKDAIAAWRSLGRGDARLFVKALFQAYAIPADKYKLGLTRVFFRASELETVNEILGAAAAGAVSKEVVARFRRSFARAIWRRALAKAIAVRRFNRLLSESRSRQSAATAMQRYMKRRKEVLEAKAELLALKAAKKRREEEEARKRAFEELERAKKLKLEADKASRAQEAERLRLEELKAQARAREEEDKAARAREEEKEATARRNALQKERDEAADNEQRERAKAVEAFGSEAAFEEQRKKDAMQERQQQEPEPELSAAAPSGGSSSSSPGAAVSKRASARRKSVKKAKPVLFEQARFKDAEPPRPAAGGGGGGGGPFACLFGKKKAPSQAESSAGGGAPWQPCAIIVMDGELRWYRSVQDGANGEPKGEGQLGSIKADPAHTSVSEAKEEGALQFAVRGSGKKLLFALSSPADNARLRGAYEEAVAMRARARDPAEDQLDEMHLGPEGAQDYRVQCPDCGLDYFLLPGATDQPSRCTDCGARLPDPLALEAEAELAQLQERDLEGGKQGSGFPVMLDVGGKKLVVMEAEVVESYSVEEQSRVFNFVFQAKYVDPKAAARRDRGRSRAPAYLEWWSFGASWSGLKSLYKHLATDEASSLGQAARSHLPEFPKDVAKNANKPELAQQRLPLVNKWMLDTLHGAPNMPELFQLKLVRKFFNLPVDAKHLAAEIGKGPLTFEQMQNIQNLVDEMVAAMHAGAEVKRETLELISKVRRNIDATADPDVVFSDAQLADVAEEDKLYLIQMANNTADVLDAAGLR